MRLPSLALRRHPRRLLNGTAAKTGSSRRRQYGGFGGGILSLPGGGRRGLLLHHQRIGAVTAGTNNSNRIFSTAPQEKTSSPESFLNGTSSLYAEQMYEMYLENPDSVHPSWKQYFDNLEQGVGFDVADYSSPTAVTSNSKKAAMAGVRRPL